MRPDSGRAESGEDDECPVEVLRDDEDPDAANGTAAKGTAGGGTYPSGGCDLGVKKSDPSYTDDERRARDGRGESPGDDLLSRDAVGDRGGGVVVLAAERIGCDGDGRIVEASSDGVRERMDGKDALS